MINSGRSGQAPGQAEDQQNKNENLCVGLLPLLNLEWPFKSLCLDTCLHTRERTCLEALLCIDAVGTQELASAGLVVGPSAKLQEAVLEFSDFLISEDAGWT